MNAIPEETWALVEQLQSDELFNKRGHTIYREKLLPLRGQGNFYEVVASDLASDDELVYEVALKALKQKIADLEQLAGSL